VDGVSDFKRLRSQQHDASVFLYAFDLLAIDARIYVETGLKIGAQSGAICWADRTGFDSPKGGVTREQEPGEPAMRRL
jgi:hypothetical protein